MQVVSRFCRCSAFGWGRAYRLGERLSEPASLS
ncbi:hypothetical protein BCL76_12622 [Streptomyces sp. CG 926]|nr:hypothetical protein BCL76_12622 [Streptomyces sp. CG 926]